MLASEGPGHLRTGQAPRQPLLQRGRLRWPSSTLDPFTQSFILLRTAVAAAAADATRLGGIGESSSYQASRLTKT